jgi:glycosyltransferase involved in cell wall biosynthesis
LIHAHLLGSILSYSILTILTRLPLVATLHGRVDINPSERFVILKQKIMRFGVDRLIAVSRDLSIYIESRRLFPSRSIDVIYNGIDPERYGKRVRQSLRTQLNIPDDAVIIGSLGNIRPAKSYETLISAVSLLKNPRLHFVVAGHKKSDLMEVLQDQMRRLGVASHIHFIGFYDNTPEFLSQLDMFVLSSSSEGFSIATIEAMAAGLPVIATRCGGPEEIIDHQRTGYLVPVGSPEQLAEAINYLLTNPLVAQDLARKGVMHMRDTFSLSTMLSQYKRHYAQLLALHD